MYLPQLQDLVKTIEVTSVAMAAVNQMVPPGRVEDWQVKKVPSVQKVDSSPFLFL